MCGSNTVNEPDGLGLDDIEITISCPECESSADHHYWQAVEGGSVNSYFTTNCDTCGYNESNMH